MRTPKRKAVPANAVHPGEMLREEFLVPLGIKPAHLAKALGVPVPRINDLMLERRGMSADTALRLSKYFGNSAQFWMNLQTAYDLDVAAVRSKGIQKITPRGDLVALSSKCAWNSRSRLSRRHA